MRHWPVRCRPDQRLPGLARTRAFWAIWLMLGGRGAGKTRAGSEWVRGIALGDPISGRPPCAASRSSARPLRMPAT